jgi:hypothetical protein
MVYPFQNKQASHDSSKKNDIQASNDSTSQDITKELITKTPAKQKILNA